MNEVAIAIVDDDAALAEGIARLVRSFGYSAVTFTSPMELLRQDIGNFQCVVSDVKMPGMDGLGLLAELSIRYPTLPVILISAFVGELKRAEALAGGAVCILSKPFDDADLEKCIEEALSRRSMNVHSG